MNRYTLYKTVNFIETAVYFYWIAMSFGYASLGPISLSLMLFSVLILQFYTIDIMDKKDLKSKIRSYIGALSKLTSIFMWFILLLGYLEYWWFLVVYYLFIIIYLFVRRPDLLNKN